LRVKLLDEAEPKQPVPSGPDAFETRGLQAFRALYPKGKNYVVCPLPGPGYDRMQDGHKLAFVSPGELRRLIG
jgi:hypothetical protein